MVRVLSLKAKLREWRLVLLERPFEVRGAWVKATELVSFSVSCTPPLPPKLCCNVFVSDVTGKNNQTIFQGSDPLQFQDSFQKPRVSILLGSLRV